ncbi:hypothetical protein ACR42A_32155 [Burkholderia gladioli]|uniref:hypothetical protein n=1 Tax=Burkholderia gladioli TaxID=28095 RepID=UPI003DA45E04
MHGHSIEYVEGDDHRWKWVVTTFDTATITGSFGFSAISFQNRNDAVADFEQHVAAPSDGKGRRILSKVQIDRLLTIAATAYEECNNFAPAPVQWQEADANGCNWFIRSAQGTDVVGCEQRLLNDVENVRAAYNIPDEG